jgi:hypothetical protein
MDDKQAFPVVQPIESFVKEWGLTKRELFAAMAMHGTMPLTKNYALTAEIVAKAAVEHADALIAELNEEKL